jgi:DNA gyrase/topoisomerase IV subunit B
VVDNSVDEALAAFTEIHGGCTPTGRAPVGIPVDIHREPSVRPEVVMTTLHVAAADPAYKVSGSARRRW